MEKSSSLYHYGTQLKPEMNTSMYIVILVRRLNTDKDIWAIQKKEA